MNPVYSASADKFNCLWSSIAVVLVVVLSGCTAESPDSDNSSNSALTDQTAMASSIGAESSQETGLSIDSIPSGLTAPTSEYNPTPVATSTTVDPKTEVPAATTPVPAPGGGDIGQTVETAEVSTQPAVTLTDKADFGNGVTVELQKIESITAEAEVLGEVSGPGLAITVAITNASNSEINLDNVVVNVEDGKRVPANPMIGPPSSRIFGALSPGSTTSGIYVFALPDNYQKPAAISVSYSTGVPVVLFVGDAQ